MGRGGWRPGSGRKRGSSTKKTRRIADEAADKGQTPLEYLLAVMVDETAPRTRRDWAAEKAAQYCHPKLSAVAVRNTDGPRTVNNIRIELVTPEGRDLPGETIDTDVIRLGPPQ